MTEANILDLYWRRSEAPLMSQTKNTADIVSPLRRVYAETATPPGKALVSYHSFFHQPMGVYSSKSAGRVNRAGSGSALTSLMTSVSSVVLSPTVTSWWMAYTSPSLK